jgi:putative transposase
MLTEPWAREALHAAIVEVQSTTPFQLEAICLLPDHLHCIWTLPEGDADYSTRWKRIKAMFSRQYRQAGGFSGEISASKIQKGEVGLWQRRFWEHALRNPEDFHRHLDYIHFNPVKHGWVGSVADWPWSSFHRYVGMGYYPADWGTCPPEDLLCQVLGE